MEKDKMKRRRIGIVIVLLTVVAVIIGLLVIHGHKERGDASKSGFATSETVSQTEPLGSFADFNVQETPIVYDGSTVTERAATTEPAGTTTLPSTTTAQEGAAATAPDAKTTTTAPTTADPTATIAKTTTTAAPAQNTTSASEYAYAYAGFDPKPANMNAQWNLILVNRDYILPENYSPDLSEAAKGTGVRMDSRVSPHYQEMYDAAKKDGITLTPLSGHRRISTQKTNFENKITKYMNQGYDRAEATRLAAKIILPPGTSEHNAGLAMDIISLDVEFEQTQAFKWLQAHAQDYGFILRYPKEKENITKITYEPWHWRYVGVPAAKAIKQSGQTLEEYLGVV